VLNKLTTLLAKLLVLASQLPGEALLVYLAVTT
jgi:ribonuclease HI